MLDQASLSLGNAAKMVHLGNYNIFILQTPHTVLSCLALQNYPTGN